MKRWFIARMVEEEPGSGSYVPKVAAYGANYRVWSKDGFGWGFGQLAARNLTAMQADPDIMIFPDAVLDMTWGSVPSATRTAVRTKLEGAGFVYSGITTGWTIRQILVKLLQQLQPALNSVEQGDVVDIEG